MAWPILGRIGWWAIRKIMARQAAKAATQAAARTATSATGRQALSAANGLGAAIQAAEIAKDLADKADEETDEQDITCPTGTCTEEENQKRREEQERKLKELEEESVLTDDKINLKNFEKKGSIKDANADFDSMNIPPEKQGTFNTKWGTGRHGQLENGGNIGVRPGSSSTNTTTLQYDPPFGPTIKWRYK